MLKHISLSHTTNGTSQNIREAGFTIVELMIASLIFSTVLVVVTVGIIKFTDGYYRGINSSTTQTTAQNAIDSISQAVQFSSGGTSAGSTGVICAGSKLITYSPGKQLTGNPSDASRGLFMMDNPTAGACANPASIAGVTGAELLDSGMRVIYVSVTDPSPTYLSAVNLKIAYGDPDLLCSPSIAGTAKGSCQVGATDYTTADAITNADTVCKPHIGSQFCSVVELSTMVQQRLVVN
jgi:Tfp pilus assembly protein PilW